MKHYAVCSVFYFLLHVCVPVGLDYLSCYSIDTITHRKRYSTGTNVRIFDYSKGYLLFSFGDSGIGSGQSRTRFTTFRVVPVMVLLVQLPAQRRSAG